MARQCVDISTKSFIRLDSNNIVKNFSCGDADLDDFILHRASAFQKHLLSVSYAYVDDVSGQILAYCSLANDKVAITDFKDRAKFNRFRKKTGVSKRKTVEKLPSG